MARTYCQLESLSKTDFHEVAANYPEILKVLREVNDVDGKPKILTTEENVEETHNMTTALGNTLDKVNSKLDEVLRKFKELEEKENAVGGGGMKMGFDEEGEEDVEEEVEKDK